MAKSKEGSPYEGEKVCLRALETSDIDNVMKNWNTYETRRNLMNTFPMSRSHEIDWIETTLDAVKKGKKFVFVIEEKETRKFLGTVGFESVDFISRSATLGIAIHDSNDQGKGYGTEAMILMLKIGFWHINLHRIELIVLDYNQRAKYVYEKVGFTEVGRKREAHYLEGCYYDFILMDILKAEFNEKYA